MTSLPPPFDLTGALPWGATAIEASAGTGKTFTLASLVVRYIAEAGVTADQHLIVTFTRAAAAELRDRVRARIVEALHCLQDPTSIEPDDPLLAYLASASDVDRSLRLERLQHALNDFDAATITTIHGFAQQVLATLGTGAPGDPEARLVDDTTDLVEAVASDQLATLSLGLEQPSTIQSAPLSAIVESALALGCDPDSLVPKLQRVTELVTAVLGNPDLRLEPTIEESEQDGDWIQAVTRQLVGSIAQTVTTRRRLSGTMSFDDILTQLRDALRGQNSPAREALQDRFRVALIDEFQDTDPVQWDIFSSIFAPSATTSTGPGRPRSLVLVGDPKQAIYSFRGANVDTYLKAVTSPDTDRFSLPVNWRSNGSVIRGLDSLLNGATFGPAIPFVPVTAAPHNEASRLTIDSGDAPGLAIRLSSPSDYGRTTRKNKTFITSGPAQALIRTDVVNQTLRLLTKGQLPGPPRAADERRDVVPSDIAILTSTNAETVSYQAALGAAGVPAVIFRGGNVFTSTAASQWRRLLLAVAQPANTRRARAAAIGWFFGWSPEALDEALDNDLAAVQDQLHEWAEALRRRGVAAFFNRVMDEGDMATFVLGQATGERYLTDAQHIAEVLQRQAQSTVRGPVALTALLDELAAATVDSEANQRRIETDAEAVKVLTMHSSKGLEFPIVLCPSLHLAGQAERNLPVMYGAGTDRILDLRKNTASGAPAHARDLARAETQAERLRLAYVALTRAEHHVIAWWAETERAPEAPLSRLLFARDADGTIDAVAYTQSRVDIPTDAAAPERLRFLANPEHRHVSVEQMPGRPAPPSTYQAPDTTAAASYAVRTLDRVPDRIPERWSFTLITNRESDHATEHGLRTDEPAPSIVPTTASTTSDLPWGDIRGSAAFGTLVHEVFENVDFQAPDLAVAVAELVAEMGRTADWPADQDLIADGIVASIRTPLGTGLGDVSLADFDRAHRRDELEFELNLGLAGSRSTANDIGALVVDHLAPADPLRSWALELAHGTFDATLAGHLTGSIDAVLQHPSTGSFYVVDYKTNKLSRPGEPAMADDYAPDLLPAAMAHHHYPLQGLLYSVGLHRFLRWRLRDYDPALHLGGMAYLFIRGMTGPQTPAASTGPLAGHRQGVYCWRPSPQLVSSLSDLLDGQPEGGRS